MKVEKKRKSKFDEIAKKLDIIRAKKRLGATDEELWRYLGIAKNTCNK